MRLRELLHYLASTLIAAAATAPVGIVAQRHMSFTLVGVDGGRFAWLLATGIVAALGLVLGLVVGIPALWIVRRAPILARRRALSFCAIGALAATGLFYAVTGFQLRAVDASWMLLLCAVFFGVLQFADVDLIA